MYRGDHVVIAATVVRFVLSGQWLKETRGILGLRFFFSCVDQFFILILRILWLLFSTFCEIIYKTTIAGSFIFGDALISVSEKLWCPTVGAVQWRWLPSLWRLFERDQFEGRVLGKYWIALTTARMRVLLRAWIWGCFRNLSCMFIDSSKAFLGSTAFFKSSCISGSIRLVMKTSLISFFYVFEVKIFP